MQDVIVNKLQQT